MNFKHFVVTDLRQQRSPFGDDVVVDEMDCLREYCQPAVLSQKVTDFVWIIQAPAKMEKKLRDFSRDSNPTVMYAFSSVHYHDLFNLFTDDETYCITTKLPHDIVLCDDHIQTIQNNFEWFVDSCAARRVVEFKYGYKYALPSGVLFGPLVNECAPVTLFEDLEQTSKTQKVEQFGGIGWMQIVHDSSIDPTKEFEATDAEVHRMRRAFKRGFTGV